MLPRRIQKLYKDSVFKDFCCKEYIQRFQKDFPSFQRKICVAKISVREKISKLKNTHVSAKVYFQKKFTYLCSVWHFSCSLFAFLSKTAFSERWEFTWQILHHVSKTILRVPKPRIPIIKLNLPTFVRKWTMLGGAQVLSIFGQQRKPVA